MPSPVHSSSNPAHLELSVKAKPEEHLPCATSCSRLCCFNQWLVTLLAPVILGPKPAEILSFSKDDQRYLKEVQEIEACSGKCQKLSILRIDCDNHTTKFLFYDPLKLSRVLSDPRMHRFLVTLGYPETYTLESYLDILHRKLSETGDFPHEIGAFLGYPLKDIMGFMGHARLKLTEVSKWRIYGDPRISVRKMAEFDEARNKICLLLKYKTPEFIFEKLA